MLTPMPTATNLQKMLFKSRRSLTFPLHLFRNPKDSQESKSPEQEERENPCPQNNGTNTSKLPGEHLASKHEHLLSNELIHLQYLNFF